MIWKRSGTTWRALILESPVRVQTLHQGTPNTSLRLAYNLETACGAHPPSSHIMHRYCLCSPPSPVFSKRLNFMFFLLRFQTPHQTARTWKLMSNTCRRHASHVSPLFPFYWLASQVLHNETCRIMFTMICFKVYSFLVLSTLFINSNSTRNRICVVSKIFEQNSPSKTGWWFWPSWKNMSSSMGRMTSHIYMYIYIYPYITESHTIPWFQTTNQIALGGSFSMLPLALPSYIWAILELTLVTPPSSRTLRLVCWNAQKGWWNIVKHVFM